MKHYGTDITDELSPHKRIKKLAINHGASNLGFITENNSVYLSGGNDEYQQGRGDDQSPRTNFTKVNIPPSLDIPANDIVKNCYILGKIIFILYKSGILLASGTSPGTGIDTTNNDHLFHQVTDNVRRLIYSKNAGDNIDKMTFGVEFMDATFAVWGWNAFQTGRHIIKPTQFTNRKILNMWIIGSGRSSIFIQDDDGDVYAAGYNAQGQLGLDHTNNTPDLERITCFDEQIIDIFGSSISHRPLRAAASRARTGAVTGFLLENGYISMVGCNKFNQLGDNDNHTHTTPVETQIHKPVKKVYQFGGAHATTYVRYQDDNGARWGYNEYGQSGVGHSKHILSPIQMPMNNITELFPVTPVGKWSDESGIFMLTKDNSLLACGHNMNGNLGTGKRNTNHNYPTPVVFNNTSGIIKDIQSCGYNGKHTSILLTDKGEAFTCGSNNLGQMGAGDTTPACVFTNITF